MRRLAAVATLALLATGCTRGGTTPSPSPTAAPTSATVTVPPIRPTGGLVHGLLVYTTDTDLYVLPKGGTARRVASATGILDVAVSAAGRYAAVVLDRPRLTVEIYDLLDPRFGRWTAPDDTTVARTIAANGLGFLVVDEGANGRLLHFDPDEVIAGRGPATTTLRGVSSARLVAANHDRILVATSEEASAHGGPETVHDVAADGTVKRLFQDGDQLPEGDIRNLPIGYAALTRDGRRLVYGAGTRGDECELVFTAVVRDLTAGREVATEVPSLGDDVVTVVHTVTTGPDGRTVVGLSTELGGCAQPSRAAAYALDGDRWTLVARGASWAASDADGRLATLTMDGVLAVAGRRIATGVRLAAWSPV